MIGLVPSNHNPVVSPVPPANTVANNVNSGGANNFPRFLENWGDPIALYIRGSMVALFESRVAMEPFTHSRCYNRPVRRAGGQPSTISVWPIIMCHWNPSLIALIDLASTN